MLTRLGTQPGDRKITAAIQCRDKKIVNFTSFKP